MGKLDGKVAFITGAARGQGRSHALRLAEEGANIIAIDICAQIGSVPYGMATPEDLKETASLVEALDRRICARQADVRDPAGLRAAVAAGIAEVGPIDIVVANAGILPTSDEDPEASWQDALDVNLTGVMHTVEAAIPGMIERGAGGAIVITSSSAGLVGVGGVRLGSLGYTASKHGVVGLMRTYANNLAQYSIRVNSVHPGGVNTPMVTNDAISNFTVLSTDMGSPMPVSIMEPIEISNAIAWLASDEARYVTGVTLPVDAGYINKR
jgi:SDR family mycofactocin-dependent oxidoreductase